VEDHHADGKNELFLYPVGDNEGGYSYGKSSVYVPFMNKHRIKSEGGTMFHGDEEESTIEAA